MPRKGSVEKRDVLPDPVYQSKLVTRLINRVMYDGKRGTAQTIIYKAFKQIEEKTGQKATDVFAAAINNIMPEVELKVRRIGAANYQVPVEVSPEETIQMEAKKKEGTTILVRFTPIPSHSCGKLNKSNRSSGIDSKITTPSKAITRPYK